MSTAHSAIPLIDLALLDDGNAGSLDRLAADLCHALEKTGFFIIVNHGVSPDLIAKTFDEARRFHAQPMAAKQAVLMNEHNNGYMAMSRYNVRTSRVSGEAKPDLNEAFFIKRERTPDDPLVTANRRFAGPNRWPADLPGFRETVLAYANAVDQMARRILPPVALSLDLPPDYFEAAFAESFFSLRLSHYPQADRDVGLFGIAPHTDANFMTFLAQSGVPGLQIMSPSGAWHDVPFVPDSFVVNTGDMLHRWTNGRYVSTAHRALPPTDGPRYAIPYFFGPHLDTEISCLPSCRDDANPAREAPITYGDYMSWWYESNYDAEDQKDLAT